MTQRVGNKAVVIGLTSFLLLGIAVRAYADHVVGMTPLIWGVESLYGPEVMDWYGQRRMWLGGWLTPADRNWAQGATCGADRSNVYGGDKIYYSDYVNGAWTTPVLSFAKVGYHVNEFGVVRPPSSDGIDRSQWLYLYYSQLSNNDALCLGQNLNLKQHHEIGFASSVDGGRTWFDHGVIIRYWQSGDGLGAWGPAPVVVGQEIRLFYFTGTNSFFQSPIFMRRLNANGHVPLTADMRVAFTNYNAFNPSTILLNPHIAVRGNDLVMVGQVNNFHDVAKYRSSNGGFLWSPDPGVIIPGGPNFLAEPSIEVTSPSSYRIFFGFGTPDSNSVHQWDLQSP